MAYEVPSEYLKRYGDLLVNYALGGGDGIRAGDVVGVRGPESAKPLYAEVCRAVWRSGGHVVHDYRPDSDASVNLMRDFFELASPGQLNWFPEAYHRGEVESLDHLAFIFCEHDPHALADVDPGKIMARQSSFAPLMQWQDAKEAAGGFTWTIGLYPTEAMAAEAQLTLEQYWNEIVKACFLDDPDPKLRWREVAEQIDTFTGWLNALPIGRLHVHGPDADLWLTLGERRRWVGGSGRNIPSFECYTSPDWRGTEGWIRFSEPLYTHGSLIKGVRLEFAARQGHGGDRRRARAAATPDDRHERRRPSRRVLADRRAAVADHQIHGQHALRRERRRTTRQHPSGDRPGNPRLLRRRSGDDVDPGLGAPRVQRFGRPHRYRLDRRPRGDGGAARRLQSDDLCRRPVPARLSGPPMTIARPTGPRTEMSWRGWGDPTQADVRCPSRCGGCCTTRSASVRGVRRRPARHALQLAPARLDRRVALELAGIVGADGVHADDESRLRHARGRSTPDLLELRGPGPIVAPDLVLAPDSHDQVMTVLERCSARRVAVVPFGGGTSVVGGVEPDAGIRTAGVVALDLARL